MRISGLEFRRVLFRSRVVRRTRREADDAILAALYQPARWLIALNGFGAALAPIRLGPTLSGYWTIGGRILFPALVGWRALSLVGALRHIVELRSDIRSEEQTSELQSLMRISYAVFRMTQNTDTQITRTTIK